MSQEIFRDVGSESHQMTKKEMRKSTFFENRIWMILFCVGLFCLVLGTGNLMLERQYMKTATAIDLPYKDGNSYVVYTNPEGKIRTIPLELLFKDVNEDNTITIYYQDEVVDGKPLTPLWAWLAMYVSFGGLSMMSLYFVYKNVHENL